MFVDQRWMDLLPGFIDRVAVLRDRGYDVAYWNLHARPAGARPPTAGVPPDGAPLRFLHFSGFDPLDPTHLSKHQNRIESWPASPSWPSSAASTRSASLAEGHREAARLALHLCARRQRAAARPHHPRRLREAEEQGALNRASSASAAPGELLDVAELAGAAGRRPGASTATWRRCMSSTRACREAFPDLDGAGGAGLRRLGAGPRALARCRSPTRCCRASAASRAAAADRRQPGRVLRRRAGRGRGGTPVDRRARDPAHRGRPDRRDQLRQPPRETGSRRRRPRRASRST